MDGDGGWGMGGWSAIHNGCQLLDVLNKNLEKCDNKATRNTATDLVESCQIAVGERGEENVFLKIVAALVQIEHDALQLQVHVEDAGGHEAANTEAVFFAFGESSALEAQK
jgi:hypothetical protein